MTWLASIIGAVVSAVLQAIFGAREAKAARVENDAAHERAGAAEAANETQQVIAETADARANLPTADDSPADLARRLRQRADADRAAGRSG